MVGSAAAWSLLSSLRVPGYWSDEPRAAGISATIALMVVPRFIIL